MDIKLVLFLEVPLQFVSDSNLISVKQQMYACTHVLTYARIHACTHTDALTHTHAQAHMHMHTRTKSN